MSKACEPPAPFSQHAWYTAVYSLEPFRVTVLSCHVALFRNIRRAHTRIRMRSTTPQSLPTCLALLVHACVLFHACILLSAIDIIVCVSVATQLASSDCPVQLSSLRPSTLSLPQQVSLSSSAICCSVLAIAAFHHSCAALCCATQPTTTT